MGGQGGNEKPIRSTWKGIVRVRLQRIESELSAATTVGEPAAVAPVADQVNANLGTAREAARPTSLVKSILAWLTGTEIEQAWRALHQAESLLYRIYDEEAIRAKGPGLLNEVSARLGIDDARRPLYTNALAELIESGLSPPHAAVPADSPPAAGAQPRIRPTRLLLQEIRTDLSQINDDAHGSVRYFRNVALAVTAILSLAMIGIAFDAPAKPWLPITHGSAPWATVWQVELVGALGGLLAAVTAFRKLQGFAGPYGLPMVMAVLKIPAGALTGLLGALWMQNAVLGVLSPQDGLTILAYVAVFGFAQEAFTSFADRQANQLLGEAKPSAATTRP